MTDQDYRAIAELVLSGVHSKRGSKKDGEVAITTIANVLKRYHDNPNKSLISTVLCGEPGDVLQYVGILQNVGSYTQAVIKYRLEQGV